MPNYGRGKLFRKTDNYHWLCAIGGSEFTAKSITDVCLRQPDTLIELVSLITTEQEKKFAVVNSTSA